MILFKQQMYIATRKKAITVRLIEKSLGQTSELDMFDKLRAAMKGEMHKQQKPTR